MNASAVPELCLGKLAFALIASCLSRLCVLRGVFIGYIVPITPAIVASLNHWWTAGRSRRGGLFSDASPDNCLL